MGPNNLIQTTTNQYLAPEWQDQVLRDNLFFGKILSKVKRWKGSQMLFPIKYQKGIASVPFSGFDVLPINQIPTTVNMFFYPSFVATNIAIAGTDISQNRSEGNGALKVLDLMEVTMKARGQDAADDIGNYLQGDGSASDGKAPMGLAGIVDNGSDLASYGGLSRATYSGLNATVTASGGTISLLKVLDLMEVTMKARGQDAADDIGNYLQGDGSAADGKAPMGLAGIVDNGSDLATYGGLSRATYQGLNAYINNISGNITLLSLRTSWNNISDGPIRPDMLLTDYTTWAYIEQLYTPFQRNMMTGFEASAMKNKETASVSGYADLVWDGMSFFRDKKVTTGTIYMLNTEFLNFYALKWWEGTTISQKTADIQGNVYEDSMYSPKGAFTWTGWIRAYNMGAINGFVILGGQLVCVQPWRNAALTNVTGS